MTAAAFASIWCAERQKVRMAHWLHIFFPGSNNQQNRKNMKSLPSSASNRSAVMTVCAALLSLHVVAQDHPTTTPPATKTDRSTAPEYRSPSTANQEHMTDQQFVYKAALGGQKEIALSQLALQKSSSDEVKKFAQKMIADHSKIGQQLAQTAQKNGLSVPPTNAFQLALDSSTPSNVGGVGDTTQSAGGSAESPRGSEVRRGDTVTPGSSTTGGAGANAGNSSTSDKNKPFGMAQIQQADLSTAKKLQGQSGEEFDKAYVSEMCKDHEQTISKFEQASRSAMDPGLKQFASNTLTQLREHNQMAEQLAQTVGAKR